MKTLDVKTARALALAKLENDPYVIAAREAVAAYKKARREETKLARKAASEQLAAKKKAARAANPEPFRAYAKARYAADPEPVRARAKKWNSLNRERKKAADKARNEAFPEKRRAHKAQRRARMRGASGSHTAADRLAILKLQKHKCAYCKASLKKDQGCYASGRKRVRYHIDHIVSLKAGGTNDRWNLQATCPFCNSRKNAKDPIAFARELGKLL